MGLDMYLNAKKFFWSDPNDKKEEEQNKVIKALFPEMEKQKLRYVIFGAGYWRKANHIHKWFVDNVQEGEDDCGSYYVSRNTIQRLLELCEQIQKDHEQASLLLPTQEGFFFGGTEYDEYYFKDIDNTINICKLCLSLPEEWEFEYYSSW